MRSGKLVPPAEVEGENLFDLLAEGRNLSFLFVHGDEVRDFSSTGHQAGVARLQELKFSLRS